METGGWIGGIGALGMVKAAPSIENWASNSVSWAQLLIALTGMIVSLGGVAILNEQRITRLEVRQQMAIDDNRAQDERYWRTVNARNAEYAKLAEKMDRISSDVTELKIAVAALATRK